MPCQNFSFLINLRVSPPRKGAESVPRPVLVLGMAALQFTALVQKVVAQFVVLLLEDADAELVCHF